MYGLNATQIKFALTFPIACLHYGATHIGKGNIIIFYKGRNQPTGSQNKHLFLAIIKNSTYMRGVFPVHFDNGAISIAKRQVGKSDEKT